ncbi:MAG: mannitol dehydrogenase family protein [Microbacterium sp.]|uniref:mannitol dehydrogenase family protein n=1 Tax=Microbacterium sp. TaxID=51671 RepID=UPI0039E54816
MKPIAEAAHDELPYDRAAVTVGWAHFGVGNFHRVHQALYVDRALRRGDDLSWGIVGIGVSDGSAAREKAERFRAQDGLYTVTEFDPDGTSTVAVVGSLVGYLHAPAEPERVLGLLSEPAVRIVSLTITEGGYVVDDTAADSAARHPATVFGYLVRALARRRAAGVAPFTVVSCDNLRHNGATTRRAVVGYAAATDLELAGWIEENVAFPNSMVDRIAPYVPAKQRARLTAASGIDDQLPAVAESYLQWVVEDDFPAGRPALEAVGVQLRPDVQAFEAVKGRMLNASHVLLSYPALLLGHRLVDEAMRDDRVRALADTFLRVDVMPLLEAPEGVALDEYRDLLLGRFANPAIGDQLVRIAGDGAAKIPVFHTATVEQLLERGADVRREALLFACYDRYLSGVDESGAPFALAEPSLTERDWTLVHGDDPLAVLGVSTFEPLGLARHPVFVAEFLRMRELIRAGGVVAAVDDAIQAPTGSPRSGDSA